MNFTAKLPISEDISDVFLGLRKNIPVENFKLFENRFDISVLKEECPIRTTLTISPSPVSECKIIVRHPTITEPSAFKAQVFVPAIPGIPKEQLKILVRSDFLDIEHKKDEWTIGLNPPEAEYYPLRVWANYWQTHVIFAKGNGSIEITNGTVSSLVRLDHPMDGTYPEAQCEALMDRINHLQRLFRVAGDEALEVSMEEIDQCHTIRSMSVEEVHEFSGLSLTIPKDAAVGQNGEQDILIVSSAIFRERRLFHTAIARTMLIDDAEKVRLKFLRVTPKETKLIDKSEETYAAALKMASENHKSTWVIRSEPPNLHTQDPLATKTELS